MKPDRLERLLRQHQDSVYREMIRVCGHREDAEDALAGAVMEALRSAKELESDHAFRAWIGTIGKRVCYKMRRHQPFREALEFAEQSGLAADAGEEMELSVLKGCVHGALESLSETYRRVYELCELEERTVPEAAKALGLSAAATKTRLLRARAIVREQLDRSVCGG